MKTSRITKAAITALSIIFIFLLNSCHKTSKTQTSLYSGEITIMADETLKPVIDAELQVFHAQYTSTKINVVYKTETDALNQLFKDSVQLIFTSRPLKKSEQDFFKSKKLVAREIKVAIDGVALITNKENTDTLLSMINLRKLLLGEITQWKQINPKSKKGAVKVVFDNRNSSTVRFMLDSILRGKEISNNNAALANNQQVLDYIKENTDAIGVIGVSWISDKRDSSIRSFLNKVNVIALSRDSIATEENSYQPYQGYIYKGYYPLTRDIYIINTEAYTGLAMGFTQFVSYPKGQLIILKTGILPATMPYREVNINQDY